MDCSCFGLFRHFGTYASPLPGPQSTLTYDILCSFKMLMLMVRIRCSLSYSITKPMAQVTEVKLAWDPLNDSSPFASSPVTLSSSSMPTRELTQNKQ